MSCSRTKKRSKPFTILLVDDDSDWRAVIRDGLALAHPGIDVRETTGGQEALEYLRGRGQHKDSPRPDLICLDVQMPGLSGQQVLRTIKSEPALKSIPVVMLTSVDDEAAKREARRSGAEDYFVKPSGRVRLVQALLEGLGEWVERYGQGRKESAA